MINMFPSNAKESVLSEKEVSEKIKRITKNLNRYIYKAKKMGLTVDVKSDPYRDVFGKETLTVKIAKIHEF